MGLISPEKEITQPNTKCKTNVKPDHNVFIPKVILASTMATSSLAFCTFAAFAKPSSIFLCYKMILALNLVKNHHADIVTSYLDSTLTLRSLLSILQLNQTLKATYQCTCPSTSSQDVLNWITTL